MMMIGAVSFQPYVYNVNSISPASMNKLSRISDNVLDKKTDFSGLAEAENENPLKKGQTLNFQDMLEMQMQRGRSTAARVMKPAEEAQSESAVLQETGQTQSATVKFDREQADQGVQLEREAVETVQNMQTAAFDGSTQGNDVSSFRMQQAISAYEMFMTA